MTAAYKKRNTTVRTVNDGVDQFWEFIGQDLGSFAATVTGGGQYTGTSPDSGDAYYPGAITTFIQSAADSVSFTTSRYDGINVVEKSSDFQIRLTPAEEFDQSISTANYKRAGGIGFFVTSTTNVENGTAQGAYFYWNGGTSDNWICKYVSPSTTETFVTTHVFEREDLYLRVVVNPSATFFFINNALVYQSTHGGDEFVSGGNPQAIIFGLKDYKIDGGASVGMTWDAIKFVQKLVTPRMFAAVQ